MDICFSNNTANTNTQQTLSPFPFYVLSVFRRKTTIFIQKTVLFILFLKQTMNMMNIHAFSGKRLHNIPYDF